MADDALFSDDDMGIGGASSASPAPIPVPAAADDAQPSSPSAATTPDTSDSRPLTIRTGSAPPVPPSSAPALMSDDDMGLTPATPGALANSGDDSTWSSLAKGAGTAIIKGAAAIPGMFGDAMDMSDYLLAGAGHLVTGRPFADVLADMRKSSASDWTDPRNYLPSGDQVAAPILNQTGEYVPTSETGKLAMAAAEAGVGGGLFGGVEAASAPIKSLAGTFARGAGKTALVGVGAQGMTDATGNPYLGLAAGAVGGVGTDVLGASLLRAAAGRPGVLGSLAQDAQDARIGRKVLGLADDPAAVKSTLLPDDAALAMNPSSIAVPGFKPTTGQATGDLGLLRAEKAMQTTDNTAFAARAGQQNAAAQNALGSVSADADPMAPSAYLQDKFNTIDQETQDAQARLTAGAQQLASALGPGLTAEDLGNTMRTHIEAAKQQAQQIKSGLYGAVDPDGALATPAAPVKEAAESILKGVDPYAEPLSDNEKRLYGLAQQMPPVMPYKSLVAFDQNLNSALPEATRASKTRLQNLKSAVMAALDGTADGVAQREAGEVAVGIRDPADTVINRLQHTSPLGSNAPAAGSSVFTPSGREIGVKYGVADAGDLTASHRPDMTANPDFPANLQPRDRSRAASDAQIADIASNLQPGRLGASASAAEGAPIVGPDGVVESGNGRVLAIQRAHAAGGPQAQAYRDFLASHGFDASGMKAPVLVRQRTTDLSPEDRVRFAQEANASPVLAQSATERAATDAGRLRDGTLSQYVPGEVSSAANRPFVRSFLNDVADKGEQGAFAAGDGSLSLDGSRRVQNALVHAGYGDSKLVASLAETGDPDIAAFGGVMADQAGRMAQLRRGIASGDIHPEADISAPVLEAGRVVQRARAGNMRLADAVAQRDAFDPISNEAHAVLRAAYGPALNARLSQSRVGAYLDDALNEAHQQTAGARLFGEPLNSAQILEGVENRHAARSGAQAPDAFAYGAGDTRSGAGASGQAGERPGVSASGARGASQGTGSSVIDRPPLAENVDPNASARLRAAKDSHIDFQQRFVNGPVSKAIETNGFRGQYVTQASKVPAMAVLKGDAGYATARAYLRDTNNAPEMIEAMTDRALAPLRSSLTPQGTVSPTGYAKWQKDYGPALRALNEADPGFASRYGDAARATELMVKAGAKREEQLDAYTKGEAGKFLGATDPSEVQKRVGSILDDKQAGPTRMRQLVREVQGNPDALEGLRRAGAAHITEKFSNATKTPDGQAILSPTKLGQFVSQRQGVLKALYPDQVVHQMGAVGHVLDRANLSTTATNIGGTSQSAQHLLPALTQMAAKHGAHSVVGGAAGAAAMQMVEHVGEHGLTPHSLMLGAGAAGVLALNSLRARAGRLDQAMINDALMNPERFAHYVSKVSPVTAEGRNAALATSIRHQLIAQPIVQRSVDQNPIQAYARGGATRRAPIVVRSPVRSMVNLVQADRDADGLIRQVAAIKRASSVQSAVEAARISAG